MSSKFYFVSGKGGVGKTVICKVIREKLKAKEIKSSILQLQLNHIEDKKDELSFNTKKILTDYISKKLKSKKLGSWIVDNSLFQAITNILPGFIFMSYWGHLYELGIGSKKDEVFIIDGPASGHALSFLKAVFQYNNIFKSGILFEDTKKIIDYFKEENKFEVVIISNPEELSLEESIDFKKSLKEISNFKSKIYLNKLIGVEYNELQSQYLKKKIETEKKLIKSFKFTESIPLSAMTKEKEIINDLVKRINYDF